MNALRRAPVLALFVTVAMVVAGCAAPGSTPSPDANAIEPAPEPEVEIPFLRSDPVSPGGTHQPGATGTGDPHGGGTVNPDDPPVLRSSPNEAGLGLVLRTLAVTPTSSGDVAVTPLTYSPTATGGTAHAVRTSGAAEWFDYSLSGDGMPYTPFVTNPVPGPSVRSFITGKADLYTDPLTFVKQPVAIQIDPDTEVTVTKCDNNWYATWWGLVPAAWRCDYNVKQTMTRATFQFIATDGEVLTASKLWRSGWTRVIPFTSGGQNFLFEQKDDGTVVIDHISVFANEAEWLKIEEVFRGQWLRGWDNFVFRDTGTFTYILSYDSKSGRAAVDKFDRWAKPGVFLGVSDTTWTPGWHLSPVKTTKGDLYAACNIGGDCVVDRINDDGSIETLHRGKVDLSFVDEVNFGPFHAPQANTASFAMRRGAEWLQLVVLLPEETLAKASSASTSGARVKISGQDSTLEVYETVIAKSPANMRAHGPLSVRPQDLTRGPNWFAFAPISGDLVEAFAIREGQPQGAVAIPASALGAVGTNPSSGLNHDARHRLDVTIDAARATGHQSRTFFTDFFSPQVWEAGWAGFASRIPGDFYDQEVQSPLRVFNNPAKLVGAEEPAPSDEPSTLQNSVNQAVSMYDAAVGGWSDVQNNPGFGTHTTHIEYFTTSGDSRGAHDLEPGYFLQTPLGKDHRLFHRVDGVTVVLKETQSTNQHVAFKEIYRVKWSSPWTDFVPLGGTADQPAFLLSYNVLTGAAALDRIVFTSDGKVDFSGVWKESWQPGWQGFESWGNSYGTCNMRANACVLDRIDLETGAIATELRADVDLSVFDAGTFGSASGYGLTAHRNGEWVKLTLQGKPVQPNSNGTLSP